MKNNETGEFKTEKAVLTDEFEGLETYDIMSTLLSMDSAPVYSITAWADVQLNNDIVTVYNDIYSFEIPGERYYVDKETGFVYTFTEDMKDVSMEIDGKVCGYNDLRPAYHSVRIGQSTGEIDQITICDSGIETVYNVKYGESLDETYTDVNSEEVAQEDLAMTFIMCVLSTAVNSMEQNGTLEFSEDTVEQLETVSDEVTDSVS